MARALRIACLIAGSAALGALPAAAQFNPFEALFGTPPRPPSACPAAASRPLPAPQEGYRGSSNIRDNSNILGRRRIRDSSNIRGSSPIPALSGQANMPPQGVPAVSSRSRCRRRPAAPPRSTARGPLGTLPPGQRPQRGGPADTSPQPGDEVIAEPPSQKINNKGALFSGLDKITGRIINFDVAIGETVQFGALQVTPRVCYTRPPTETSNTDAFIEVDEVTLQGDVKRIFTGWMFAASPGCTRWSIRSTTSGSPIAKIPTCR